MIDIDGHELECIHEGRTLMWFRAGNLSTFHRFGGPATIGPNGEEYYVFGVPVTVQAHELIEKLVLKTISEHELVELAKYILTYPDQPFPHHTYLTKTQCTNRLLNNLSIHQTVINNVRVALNME